MPTVLLADDNSQNLYMLEVLLKGHGYSVMTATNGKEALASALAAPPDIVVSDILMPVMDGYTLCREWKKHERLRSIPFVFYTATYTEAKDEVLALSLGADRFVIKPQEPEILVNLISDVLDGAAVKPAAPADNGVKTDDEFLKGYSETLFRKLEKKMADLERVKNELEHEIEERKRVNDELNQLNQTLEERVSERTAQLAEAVTALKQQKKMLEELNSTLEMRVREEVAKNREKDILLIQQNRQAALGELFDHIAHQWKQPLNSIAVIIQALGSTSAHKQVTTKDILETVDNIMDMVRHMAQTVDVFRNFYKPDKERSVFLIKDSIDKAVSFVTPVLSCYGIEIDLDAAPELSAFGYPKEYAQVLLNILANAKDAFIERRTENPRINIKAFADGDNTVVTIMDNAGGIPVESIESIFDLYFTTKESTGGTGIGLYMSKNIIEKNMGGKLSVSNFDNGAQFRIELGKS